MGESVIILRLIPACLETNYVSGSNFFNEAFSELAFHGFSEYKICLIDETKESGDRLHFT